MSPKAKEKMQISYFHKLVERFLIYAVIATFIFGVISFLRDIAVANNKDIISLWTFPSVLLTQLISFIIISVYFNEKSKTSNFIRFIAFYLIAIAVILFFTSRWINAPIVFLATAIQTVLYYKVFSPFFEHDCFEEQCTAKNNTALQKELYDYNMHLTQSAEGYKQNRATFVILGGILAILAGLSIATDIRPSIFSIILLITYFVCAGAHFFLYGYYVREAAYASNGFTNVFDFRLKTIGTSVVIFFFCFLAGILVSSNHSPLKLSYLLYFFRLFKPKEVDVTPPTVDAAELEYERRLEEIRDFTASATDTDTKGSHIFAICCGLFFIIAIAWYFLKPFVSKKFYALLRTTDIKSIFKRFFKNVRIFFKNLFTVKIKHSPRANDNSRRFMNEMEEFLSKSRKSKEKRAELDRLSKVFVKLIDWGEEHGITYTKNLAPAEYTALFKNKNADIAGLLFEQALYAKDPLTKEQEEDFNKAVQKVCKDGVPELVEGVEGS
ncbi:MAG: hypothetical protein IK024_02310 [Treponema sp.]|nr:hypothetical protein [Treponema sp.]